ncbi:MAG: NADH:ubiquinone reductase (Na(+)-transporting) subunit C [Candidatus Cyclobacteriaceae bacterium M3_2C_046]
MQQSNGYILIFSLITTIVIGGLLSLASVGLKPAQLKAEELDTKQQILSAVMELGPEDDVLEIYDNRITSIIVNVDGEVINTNTDGETIEAEDVDIGKQFKRPVDSRLLPVFIFQDENSDQVLSYIFPVYGNGLWDNIWGYVALDTDLVTVRGARFAHAGETPGLGARITTIEVQDRYRGKKIYNDLGDLISVSMLKAENNPPDALDPHHVDGMSGATITGRGVNNMLKNYFDYYDAYIKKIKQQGGPVTS